MMQYWQNYPHVWPIYTNALNISEKIAYVSTDWIVAISNNTCLNDMPKYISYV